MNPLVMINLIKLNAHIFQDCFTQNLIFDVLIIFEFA